MRGALRRALVVFDDAVVVIGEVGEVAKIRIVAALSGLGAWIF